MSYRDDDRDTRDEMAEKLKSREPAKSRAETAKRKWRKVTGLVAKVVGRLLG